MLFVHYANYYINGLHCHQQHHVVKPHIITSSHCVTLIALHCQTPYVIMLSYYIIHHIPLKWRRITNRCSIAMINQYYVIVMYKMQFDCEI